MDERELRMECIKAVVAADISSDALSIIDMAQQLFEFVRDGKDGPAVESTRPLPSQPFRLP